MGFYINPKEMEKEDWLERHGRCVGFVGEGSPPPFRTFIERGEVPVVLVWNVFPTGSFTAAGVAYSEEEYKLFTSPSDRRSRKVYAVPVDKIVEECPEVAPYLPKEEL